MEGAWSYGVVGAATDGVCISHSQACTTTYLSCACLAKTVRTLEDIARVPRGRWLLATLAALSPVEIAGLVSDTGWRKSQAAKAAELHRDSGLTTNSATSLLSEEFSECGSLVQHLAVEMPGQAGGPLRCCGCRSQG